MPELSETDLALQQQFLGWLKPCHLPLSRYCRSLSRDTEEARDLMSETLLQAWQHIHRLRKPEKFQSYLFGIARRLWLKRLRKAKRQTSYDPEALAFVKADTADTEAGMDLQIVMNALHRLPPKQQEALALHEIAGLSLEEIRQIQGGTTGAVKQRIHRARKTLATSLGYIQSSGRADTETAILALNALALGFTLLTELPL